MGILGALSFLTVIRTGSSGRIYDGKEVAAWGRCFFFVGLLIGAAAGGIDYLLMQKFGTLTSSVFCVMFIVIITGGLHIDGVADTFDAAFSMKSVKGKLAIMKQSSIGAFGAVAVIFVIILKVTLLAEITGAERFKAILIFPAISRVALLAPAYIFDYPKDAGKGAGFVKNMTVSILLFGVITAAAVLYIITGKEGLALLLSAILFSALIAYMFSKKIFNKKKLGITGDVLGCINELTEIFVLFCISIQ